MAQEITHVRDLLPRLVCRENAIVLEAWLRWRGEQLLPSRKDVRPQDIKPSLPWIVIHQPIDANTSILRLIGTGLVSLTGFDPTGRNHRDITAPDHWPERSRRSLHMINRPCAGYSAYGRLTAGALTTAFEAINLPLDNGDGPSKRLILSSTVPLSNGIHVPHTAPTYILPTEAFQFVDIGAGR